LVKNGQVPEALVDEAVRRILRVKFALGLFDDPFKYVNKDRQREVTMSEKHLQAAREMAQKSIVLLKNEDNLLPLDKDIETLAVVGQLANSKQHEDMMGTWFAQGKNEEVVTPLEGIQKAVPSDTEILYASGCEDHGKCPQDLIDEAVKTAKKADAVVLVVGENGDMSGESKSRAYIELPGDQLDLVKAIHKTGKPVVMVLMTGRPLAIAWCDENIPAIVNAWQLGTMGGHAIADVLFGDYNPSGKLPVSFPVTLGQVPVYYNHLNTGRPRPPHDAPYVSRYIDAPNDPLYPFGYGLSYTTFEYSNLSLDATEMNINGQINASIDIQNTGDVAGEEVVQLYIRDLVASVARPVKELKGFIKIQLEPGESKRVTFHITNEDLKVWTKEMEYKSEPGEFKLFIGPSSAKGQEAKFVLE
jgi:beta-glucosidase